MDHKPAPIIAGAFLPRNSLYFLALFALFFTGIAAKGLIDPAHTYISPVPGTQEGEKHRTTSTGVDITPFPLANPPLSLAQSDADLLRIYGPSDPASYAKGANLMFSGIDVRNDFIFSAWAPGMMVIEGVLIKLFGHAHLMLSLFIVTAVAWAACLTFCAAILLEISGNRLYPLCLFAIFASALFRTYFFRSGIIMSESLSSAFFMSGGLGFIYGMSRRSWPCTLTGGALLTAVPFMRAQGLLVCETFFGLQAIMIVVALALNGARRQNRLPVFWQGALASLLIFLAATGSYAQWNKGQFVHNEYFYAQPWNTPKDTSDDFGGGRALCDLDPANCARQATKSQYGLPYKKFRSAALRVILHHPIGLIAYKTPYLAQFFFADPSYLVGGIYGFAILENTVFLALLLATLVLCVIYRHKIIARQTALLLAAVWIGCIAPSFLLLHFEVRYLFIAKAVTVIAALAMGAVWSAERHTPIKNRLS